MRERNKAILFCVLWRIALQIVSKPSSLFWSQIKCSSKERWLDIVCISILRSSFGHMSFLWEVTGDPGKNCHVLTQYVAQSLNRFGFCADYSGDIENDENVFFFARHPEAVLWRDAHRVTGWATSAGTGLPGPEEGTEPRVYPKFFPTRAFKT